jgi:hypothetical protein
MFALKELVLVLADACGEAWQTADLGGRLRAWWWTIHHRDLLDGPIPDRMIADAQ